MRLRPALVLSSSIALAVGALPVWTGAAQAAGPLTAEITGGAIVVEGSAKGDKIYVDIESPTSIQISVSDQVTWGTVPLTPGAGCAASSIPMYVRCPTAGVTKVIVRGGEGDDLLYVGWQIPAQNAGYTMPMEMYGGNGRDDLRGGPGDDKLYGEGGNDTQIIGGLGADLVSGGEGNDVGLAGEATGIQPSQFSPDIIDGGPGIDTFEENSRNSIDRVQYWSLDGLANDGSDLDDDLGNGADEGDNILPTVENIVGTYNDEFIIGSDADNQLSGGLGRDFIVGNDGDDVLSVGSSGGAIDGGPGDDEIFGYVDMVVLGGDGMDKIQAGGYIDAGPGMDTVDGRVSNDIIVTTDGVLDQVSCGSGADIIYSDSVDVLDTDPYALCELEVGAVGTRKLLPGSISLTIDQPGAGQLTVVVLDKGKALGRSTVTTTTQGAAPVTIPLSAKDKKRLARVRSLPVTVQTSFLPAGEKTPLRAERAVTLTR